MMRTRYSVEQIEQHLAHNIYSASDFGSSSTSAGSSGGSGGSDAVAASVGPVLRAINESRQHDAFLRQLNEFVAGKEHEIEVVCRDNYQDFVSSTDKLLKVRQGTVSLKHRVHELNNDIEEKGGQLADKKKALFDTNRVGQNIDEAIDTLQACLRVLDLMSKIHGLVDASKYFAALRSLDELHHTHLKPLQHLAFANQMLSTLPATRLHIKDSVLRGMKAWMFEAREASRTVGALALQATDQRNRRWKARKSRDSDGALRLARLNGAVELVISERHEYYNILDPYKQDSDEAANDQAAKTPKVDFKPLYQCILIHSALDASEELQTSYAEDRKAQASLLLSTNSLAPLSSSGLSTLLDEICGFFVIENQVIKTTTGFRSEQQVDELWDGMIDKVIGTLSEELAKTDNIDLFLDVKVKLIAFTQTMETYGFVVHALHQFQITMFRRFSEVLERKVGGDLEQIIGEGEEEHQPMMVQDYEDFEKVASVSWLPMEGPWSEPSLKQREFPLTLPFSQTYPLCCIDIRNYVDQFYQFVESSSRPTQETDDSVKRLLDRMLTNCISLKIRNRLPISSNIAQLSLTMVNLLFFETACCELEVLLSSLKDSRLGPPSGSGSVSELDSVASFRATLDATSDRMVNIISAKTDSFFELAEYNWTPSTPASQIEEVPSSYLTEMVDYLKLLMDSVLHQLPDVLKDTVYRRALKHVADVMMSCIVEPHPPKMNDAGLAVFAVDVRFVVHHVGSFFSGNSPESGANDVFEELSQLVALLQSDTLTEFLDPDIRELAFPQVQNQRLQFALIKLVTYYNSVSSAQVDPQRRKDAEELLKDISRS